MDAWRDPQVMRYSSPAFWLKRQLFSSTNPFSPETMTWTGLPASSFRYHAHLVSLATKMDWRNTLFTMRLSTSGLSCDEEIVSPAKCVA